MSAYRFRPLIADDVEQLLDVRAVSFGRVADRERAATLLLPRLQYSLGAFRGGRLRSVTFMLPLAGYLAGHEFTLGGLGSVATSPESRRSGLVTEALRRWFEDLRERGIGWSAEHPFEPSFYARYGYQTALNGHTIELPVSELRRSVHEDALTDLDAEPLTVASAARLKKIYAAYARRFSFALSREDDVKDHWSNTFQPPWESKPRSVFLMKDAYLVFTTEDDPAEDGRSTMAVRDFAYSSPAGRSRLLAMLVRFEDQATTVRLHLPPGDSIALDRVAYRSARAPELQLRVIDLERALTVLTWPRVETIRLRVVDAECPWNDGIFDIEVGPQGASVKRTTVSDSDASLNVAALAALLVGAATPETLIADGRAQGAVSKLRRLTGGLQGYPIFKPENDHF